MQPLTIFSIIAVAIIIVVIVTSSNSSNVFYKFDRNIVNTGVAPIFDSILLLLDIDDKSTFSSLLHPINAQEAEEEEENRGEDEERESFTEQEQEEEQQQEEGEEEEQQDNNISPNNNRSPNDNRSGMDSKAQDSSQNLKDSNARTTSTATNNNTAVAASENGFTLKCQQAEAKMLPGQEGSINCTVENKSPEPIEVVLECSGLEGTGIGCYINGEYPAVTDLVKEMSYTNFEVILVSSLSPPVSPGSYPFTISAEERR